jgi:hypothetical protein
MPAEYPPFMNGYGTIKRVFNKIKEAQTPDRFTQDFLSTKLGSPGGSAKPFIPLAKRLGFLESDGKPTDLYKQFRNPETSKAAMAAAIRKGYSQLYERNEYAQDLDKKRLEGLVLEITGLEQGHATARAIVGSFEALKAFADFNKPEADPKRSTKAPKHTEADEAEVRDRHSKAENVDQPDREELSLNLAYTINLVLPKTDDVAVFNAIFKSLREHLLRR